MCIRDSWKGGPEAKTALLRSFARVFYEHLGFYGEDLRLARMEQFVESQGKTQTFREAFARINGCLLYTSNDWAASATKILRACCCRHDRFLEVAVRWRVSRVVVPG